MWKQLTCIGSGSLVRPRLDDLKDIYLPANPMKRLVYRDLELNKFSASLKLDNHSEREMPNGC
jgi:hypothetical protein